MRSLKNCSSHCSTWHSGLNTHCASEACMSSRHDSSMEPRLDTSPPTFSEPPLHPLTCLCPRQFACAFHTPFSMPGAYEGMDRVMQHTSSLLCADARIMSRKLYTSVNMPAPTTALCVHSHTRIWTHTCTVCLLNWAHTLVSAEF